MNSNTKLFKAVFDCTNAISKADSIIDLIEHADRSVLLDKYKSIFCSQVEFVAEKGHVQDKRKLLEMQERVAVARLEDGESVAAVAVLALYHTAIEIFFKDILLVISEIDPIRVFSAKGFLKRKMSLEDAWASSPDQIVNKVVTDWVGSGASDSSMLDLFRVVCSALEFDPTVVAVGEEKDIARLGKLDRARHDAVHGRGVVCTSQELRNDGAYLINLAFTVTCNTANELGLVFDEIQMDQILSRKR